MASQLYLKEVETIQMNGASMTTPMARQAAALTIVLNVPLRLCNGTPPDSILEIGL